MLIEIFLTYLDNPLITMHPNHNDDQYSHAKPYDAFGVQKSQQEDFQFIQLKRTPYRNQSGRSKRANAALFANIALSEALNIEPQTQRIEGFLEGFHDIEYYLYLNKILDNKTEHPSNDLAADLADISDSIQSNKVLIQQSNKNLKEFNDKISSLTDTQLEIITKYSMMFE